MESNIATNNAKTGITSAQATAITNAFSKYGGTLQGQLIVKTASDAILTLRQTDAGTTSGVKEGGWNYMQFQDGQGDRIAYFGIDNNGNLLITQEKPGSIIKANGTLNVNGNVGIGTTSPTTKLHISDASTPEVRIQDTTNNRYLSLYQNNSNSYVQSSLNSALVLSTHGANERMRITTAGNVGIGTSAPAQKLDVNGNANISGTLDVTATGSPLVRLYQSTSRKGFIQMNTSTNTLRVASEYGSVSLEAASTSGVDSDTSYIRINPGGTVEIGAVNGDATISTDGNMTFKIDADNDESSQKFSFVNNAGTEIANLDESGKLTLTGGISVSLPTSPGATGTLWNDRGLVRVS